MVADSARSVSVVGHSMGGSICAVIRRAASREVLALVGIGPRRELPEQGRAGMATRAETVETQGMGAVAETVATNGVAPTFREHNPEEFQELISMLAGTIRAGYAAQCRALVGLDLVGSSAPSPHLCCSSRVTATQYPRRP